LDFAQDILSNSTSVLVFFLFPKIQKQKFWLLTVLFAT